jgi:hypothetical protein
VGADLESQAKPVAERRLGPLPAAISFPEKATWTLRSDRKLDGQVERDGQEDRLTLWMRKDMVTGEYVGRHAQGKENRSKFSGEITRTPAGAPLLTLRQTDKWYAATYTGRLVRGIRFVGCWFDSDGRSGDVELVLERK